MADETAANKTSSDISKASVLADMRGAPYCRQRLQITSCKAAIATKPYQLPRAGGSCTWPMPSCHIVTASTPLSNMQPLNMARILGGAVTLPSRLSSTLAQAKEKPLISASPSGSERGRGSTSWFQAFSAGCSTSITPTRARAMRSSVNSPGLSPESPQVSSTDHTGIRYSSSTTRTTSPVLMAQLKQALVMPETTISSHSQRLPASSTTVRGRHSSTTATVSI